MNLNEPISVCVSPGVEFTKSLIEILLHSNMAESLAALQATAVTKEGCHVTPTVVPCSGSVADNCNLNWKKKS